MKVILTQEVKGKGHEGDVVEVARGYAANYLLPRNMAIPATPGNLKQLEARMNNIEKRNADRRGAAEQVAASIEGQTIIIQAKAGDEGKLFGSVTTTMIEEAIANQLGQDVDHRRMDLSHPIKELGEQAVSVVVFGEVRAAFTVRVVAEGGVTEAAVKSPAEIVQAVEEAEAAEEAAEDAAAAQEPVEAGVDVEAEPASEIEAEKEEGPEAE